MHHSLLQLRVAIFYINGKKMANKLTGQTMQQQQSLLLLLMMKEIIDVLLPTVVTMPLTQIPAISSSMKLSA